VLVIDDSTYDRSHSKFVELLARVFDHCDRKYLKRFKTLTVGWTDGASFLPMDFVLLSSEKEKSRLQGITKNIDKRTCGYIRRKEAMTKATEQLEPMVERILATGIDADYILMDSWFAFPSVIGTLHRHRPVICMLKDLSVLDALQRIMKLALDKVRAAGELAEDVIMKILDAVMSVAIDMLKPPTLLEAESNG
jgi:hypothetical protein